MREMGRAQRRWVLHRRQRRGGKKQDLKIVEQDSSGLLDQTLPEAYL